MLCLGAPGLGTPCCGSSGVRGLMISKYVIKFKLTLRSVPAFYELRL